MINANMREYPFYTIGGRDEYGQEQISEKPTGAIKMAIHLNTMNINGNILYTDAQYIGLTHNTECNDTYVIEYGKERLKVLYVYPVGRMRQVFMARM